MLAATDVSAQMCNGTAPFSVGKMRAGAGLGFGNGATAINGEFAYGAKSGFYGGVTLGLLDLENSTEGQTNFGLNGGKSSMIGATKKIEMCPQLLIGFSSGPNVGTTDVSGMQFGAGASFGTKMDTKTSYDIIPFGAAYLIRSSSKVSNGTTTLEGSSTDLSIGLGAGFVFNQKWTLRPSIGIPLTGNGADPTFSVMGSMNFGGKP